LSPVTDFVGNKTGARIARSRRSLNFGVPGKLSALLKLKADWRCDVSAETPFFLKPKMKIGGALRTPSRRLRFFPPPDSGLNHFSSMR
jgi:hypothetical protein